MTSSCNLHQEGFEDCKAGEIPCRREVFRSQADYEAYLRGYNAAKSGGRNRTPELVVYPPSPYFVREH